MSRQHTALHLREKANEAERSALSHQKTQFICFKTQSFSKMEQVESDIGENLGRPRSDAYQYTN